MWGDDFFATRDLDCGGSHARELETQLRLYQVADYADPGGA
jgi:hypothetical protein